MTDREYDIVDFKGDSPITSALSALNGYKAIAAPVEGG
jgi:hypothetical protein